MCRHEHVVCRDMFLNGKPVGYTMAFCIGCSLGSAEFSSAWNGEFTGLAVKYSGGQNACRKAIQIWRETEKANPRQKGLIDVGEL